MQLSPLLLLTDFVDLPIRSVKIKVALILNISNSGERFNSSPVKEGHETEFRSKNGKNLARTGAGIRNLPLSGLPLYSSIITFYISNCRLRFKITSKSFYRFKRGRGGGG